MFKFNDKDVTHYFVFVTFGLAALNSLGVINVGVWFILAPLWLPIILVLGIATLGLIFGRIAGRK